MREKYYIVPFSYDGFIPITLTGSIPCHDSHEDALKSIEKLLLDRKNEKWQFTIIKAYEN